MKRRMSTVIRHFDLIPPIPIPIRLVGSTVCFVGGSEMVMAVPAIKDLERKRKEMSSTVLVH